VSKFVRPLQFNGPLQFDAASQSDHPIAIAFVGRVCYMYGVDSEMYKGAMKRYESREVEAAQNILNLWGKWCFETFQSDENVAFRTKIVDMIATSYMQNKQRAEGLVRTNS